MRARRPQPRPAIGEEALCFPGVAGDILLPRGSGLGAALESCLAGWRAERRPASPSPLSRVMADGRATYRLTSRHQEAPARHLPPASVICGLIADLAEGFCDTPGRIGLHCGAFRFGNGPLILLAGRAKAGKSTLIARLGLAEGVQIFCDDVLPINADGTAVALGAAPRLRLPMPAVLRVPMQPHVTLRDDAYAYVLPPSLAPHGSRAPLGALIAVQRRDGPARLHHLAPDQALGLFLGQTITDLPEGGAAYRTAAQLLHGLPCLTLAYSDLDEAAALLAHAFDSQGQPNPAFQPEPALPAAPADLAAAPLPADLRLTRSPGATLQQHGEGVFLWRPGIAALWQMNPLGAAIWALLEIPSTSAEIAQSLASFFPDTDPAQITVDVGRFLGAARAEGLVEPV